MDDHLDAFLIEKFRGIVDQIVADLNSRLDEIDKLIKGDTAVLDDTGMKGEAARFRAWKSIIHPHDTEILELCRNKEWVLKAAHRAKWWSSKGGKILAWVGIITTAVLGMFGKELGTLIFKKLFGG